jgi:Rrf2 family transcriptional regulator, iron-sulfur cluster assembly transcription factor
MRLTSKGRYAVRAMLDLTFHANGNPVRLQEISTRQTISLHYLEQLFRKLRNGQVVKSVRGPGGGYVLARSSNEISVKNILDCVGENINPAKDIIGNLDESNNSVEFSLTRNYFKNLGAIMQEYLESTTLGDLLRKAQADNLIELQEDRNEGQQEQTLRNLQAEQPQVAEQSNLTTAEEEAISTEKAIESTLASIIRSSAGEINQ